MKFALGMGEKGDGESERMMVRFSDLTIPPNFWEIIDAGMQDEGSMDKTLQALTKEELAVFGIYFHYAVDDLVSHVQE